jgi:anti-sigma factor RsiW
MAVQERLQKVNRRGRVSQGGRLTGREFTEFLHEYLFGDRPAEERAGFERHLAECPFCRDYLATYRQTVVLEREAYAAPDAPPPA